MDSLEANVKNGKVVLVVDDSITIRKSLKAILEKEGYIVREAASEIEMLDVIYEYGKIADIILMDVILNNENGFELVQNLKNSDIYHNIPVIFLTQNSQKDNVILAKLMGVQGYMVKPVEHSMLIKRIKNIIGEQMK